MDQHHHVTVNLAEKLHWQLAKHKNPIVVMNQLMYKRIFPNVAVHDLPGHSSTVRDPISNLDICIDNNVPADRIDVMDGSE